jgi:hypothetical protein
MGRDPFPKEPDTLTAHDRVHPRRDTMPLPREGEDLLSRADVRGRLAIDDADSTMAIAQRSKGAREVYRLFLASEYAPALELAEDLIARGEHDTMLLTIARECRSTLARSAGPLAIQLDPKMTLEEAATLMGLTIHEVIALLERHATRR